jgi:eukaryotic-like serine/threonine-protein kinase
LADQSSAIFAPAKDGSGSGYLIFARDGKLMAQPFNSKTLELGGTTTTLADTALVADSGAAAVSVSDTGVLTYLGGRSRQVHSRLTWFERSGKPVEDQGMLGSESPFALSPDEKSVAVVRRPAAGRSSGDIWLRELSRGTETRFTYANSVFGNPVWAPDGNRLAFSAGRPVNLYWKHLSGAGDRKVVLKTPNDKHLSDWSPDGRFLLYTEIDPTTNADLWYVPVEGSAGVERKPVPFAQTPFIESFGRFSPDGHWVAYVSDESGSREVYVRPFPSGSGKWRISTNGGSQPRWSRDGKELFYLTGPTLSLTLISVAVRATAAGFEADAPKPVFEVRANDWHPAYSTFFYTPTANNLRFLINHIEGTDDPVLNVVVNWDNALATSR